MTELRKGSQQSFHCTYSAFGMEPVTFAATDAVTTDEKLACAATVETETGFVPAVMKGPSAAAAVVVLLPLTLVIRPVNPSVIS